MDSPLTQILRPNGQFVCQLPDVDGKPAGFLVLNVDAVLRLCKRDFASRWADALGSEHEEFAPTEADLRRCLPAAAHWIGMRIWEDIPVGFECVKNPPTDIDDAGVNHDPGRSVPLATQQQFLDDAARIRQFRQNARIFRRDIERYFPKSATSDEMRWVALPGDGLVREPVMLPVEQDVATGDLYFKSPTMQWEAGTHRLVFDHEKRHAELPIRLE